MNSVYQKLEESYKNKVVLITGHSGFKGAWISELLLMLGAKVNGISLPPNTTPSLFEQNNLEKRIDNNFIDIRQKNLLISKIVEISPDYIFHMAAQPLVRRSYQIPLETYEINFMGTVHILEALRQMQAFYQKNNKICSSVFITTDKCYENKEKEISYRESDLLGGFDPYSSSKAASELAIAAYRNSFMSPVIGENSKKLPNIGVSSVRAGNVIGGGDWATDRLVPDSIKSLSQNKIIRLRNPNSTRPWQHVLDPITGYLILGAKQRKALKDKNKSEILKTCGAYNFGPLLNSNVSVKNLIKEVLKHWPGKFEISKETNHLHEASKLNLAWDKAYHLLSWYPKWDLEKTIKYTVNWYKKVLLENLDPKECTIENIQDYFS